MPTTTVPMERRSAARTNRRDALVESQAPLVRRIAYHLLGRLPPSVQVEDLIQAGMIGLLEAARSYAPHHGASFGTFAGIRIRGAMLDEIRRSDWAPRSLHRKRRQAARAIREIENRERRDPRDREVADRMGMSLDEYHRIRRDTAAQKVSSLDDPGPGGGSRLADLPCNGLDPLAQLEETECRRLVTRYVSGLPTRERLVISLYYGEGLNLREIGSRLEVSESRVCQIRGQAVRRLRARARTDRLAA
ncbi:MAG: RNA polymerase sigma factor FliA [Gammaproteobacteria bacterium]|nr:RNA polymerase sigma factor FliA [Gammaproteobacteria bacterium]